MICLDRSPITWQSLSIAAVVGGALLYFFVTEKERVRALGVVFDVYDSLFDDLEAEGGYGEIYEIDWYTFIRRTMDVS